MRFYENIPESELAAQLRSLGGAARRILEECVEHQEITRTKASKSAERLYDAGFLFIRETNLGFGSEVVLRPSLLGEEALEAIEKLEAEATAARKASPPSV